jgi:lipopolysaccharide transport system ATP-binding protein
MSAVQHVATKTEHSRIGPAESQLFLDVRNVSKRYHLWQSPRARLVYGLWSQVPAWAPHRLHSIAQKEKARLGRDFYALQNVSFQLRRGESAAILGRNGSGKSTLLQIVCGTLQASAGSVERRCQRVAALLELGSGFNPDFTGRENVFLNGAVLGLSKEEIEAKFEDILKFAEIGEFIEQPVKTYSSGMMVRLAFAVQVLLDPELLIVDEALAVGDVFFQQKCFAHMRKLKERGCSFLIVSHDTNSLQHLCDRGVVLIGGHKYFEGVTRDAIREYYLTEKVNRAGGTARIGNEKDKPSYGQEKQQGRRESGEIAEPERWFYPEQSTQATDSLARLTRWSCADDSGKTVDQFFESQSIRLFVEFECEVPVHEVSAGFGIRDKTGQVVYGKHLYQMHPGTKISMDSPFLLLCEFTFTCHLVRGEYTVEFGLLDISPASDEIQAGLPGMSVAESQSTLYWGPPVGRFVVVAQENDPIRRRGHYGIVDVIGEVRFRTTPRQGKQG